MSAPPARNGRNELMSLVEGSTTGTLRAGMTGVLLLALAGCGGGASNDPQAGGERPAGAAATAGESATTPLNVYAVNYPLAYFAERIGGAHVEVTLPRVFAQGDPAYAEPDADTVAAFQGADLIVRNGAGFDPWFDRVTLPPAKIVDTSADLGDRLITIEGAITHSHGPEGEHSHNQTAFTTWLDPLLAIEQAAAIAAALTAQRPGATAVFDANLAALRADLEEVDGLLFAAAADLGDSPLLASYPVYQYFARRYGLNVETLQLESWAMPTEAQWNELAALHAEHPARLMIWESEPIAEIGARLATMGIEPVVIEPCATPPGEGDLIAVMQRNAANLAAAGR
jgi:zinc transport system substrate-binding protein